VARLVDRHGRSRLRYSFSGHEHHGYGDALFEVCRDRTVRQGVAFQMVEATLSGVMVSKPSEEFGSLYKWLMRGHKPLILRQWQSLSGKLSTDFDENAGFDDELDA